MAVAVVATSRRIRANRRRWAEPMPVIRVGQRLTAEDAEHIKRRWAEAVRRRGPILVDPTFEVIR